MSVVGSISIKDSASSVLKSVRKEQTSLRKDAADTRKELQRTWDKTYTAKMDTASAVKKTESLIGKAKQLGSRVISPVIKVKDNATAKITKIKNAIKGVAKKVTTPIIKLKDAASSAIGKVTNKLKAIGGKTFSAVVSIKDATSQGLASIGSKIKSIAKATVIPITAAVTISTAAIGGAVSQGAALEQSIGGVETLFKENASIVKANAASAFATAGLSANEYMSQVTSFSASLLSSLSGDTAKAASVADMAMVDMADNANKFGTEIESVQNAYQGFAKQNYTMLDNLKLGYGGTKEEMQRLLSDASKFSGVEYNIDNLSDVYSAIHEIQKKMGVANATADEAKRTFSGSFASMKAAAQNVLGNMAIGGDVTGSMKQLVESASTFLFDNAVPMIGRVISSFPEVISTAITTAGPKLKEVAGGIVTSLKDGMISILPSSMGGMVNSLFDGIGSLGNAFKSAMPQIKAFGSNMVSNIKKTATAWKPAINSIVTSVKTIMPSVLPAIESISSAFGGLSAEIAPLIASIVSGFAPLLPRLSTFGSGMVSTIQSVVAACMPALTSIISTVQNMLPVILPVIQSVVSSIGNIIGQAAPVISGLVSGIGTVVSTLAPIFSTIFTEIGEKVGTVISFVSERMGFIQEVIGTVAPLLGDIISTAWGVISPVIDIVISVFEILFSVVQKVFPGIQSILETVWGIVKPLVEGIGSVIGEIAGWFGSVADAITGSGGEGKSAGKNADGDNNWKGGLTWVGEEGAELVDLPRGSRILPHKESVSFAKQRNGAVKGSTASVVQNTVVSGRGQDVSPVLQILMNIDENLKVLIDRVKGREKGLEVPKNGKPQGTAKGFIGSISVAIAKLADEIIVREDTDIDEIADRVAKKVLEVVVNMG